MLRAAGILLLISIIFFNCTEYEEGPYFSLRSKESKVTTTWLIESVTELSTEQVYTSMYKDWELEIKGSRSYTLKIVYLDNNSTQNGTWEFDGKKHIRFYYQENGNNYLKKYEIIRLTKKEMWLRDELEEIHYRKK